jgi:hypothetical protein
VIEKPGGSGEDEEPVPVTCVSCGRVIPDGGLVCAYCDDQLPDPKPGYRDLRAAVRNLRGWVILSFVLGVVVAPFAIYRITRALARFRHVAEDDPVSYREMVVLRRMAVGLLLLWALLAAGYFGLELRGSNKKTPEALVIEATLTRMVEECDCEGSSLYLHPDGLSSAAIARISEKRQIVLEGDDRGKQHPQIEVYLFQPRFRGEDVAEVPAQLRHGRTGSFGATYTLKRDARGRWAVVYRDLAWQS